MTLEKVRLKTSNVRRQESFPYQFVAWKVD